MVALFGTRCGCYNYILKSMPSDNVTVFGPAKFIRENGEARIEANFDASQAAIVFFGAQA